MSLYSVMIALAATSIWLGRNQSLYNFWFYITNFSRYPMEIYRRGWGVPLWGLFTFVIPVLLVVNVQDSWEIPGLAEPWYLTFNARTTFRIAMTPDDLALAGLEELGGKWG